MSREFVSTARYRPCPLCGDTSGDCRLTSRGNLLCHSAAYGEEENAHWKYVKLVEPAPWGLYVPRGAFRFPERQRQVIVKQTRDRARQERRQSECALSAREFDRTFRALKAPTGLDRVHRRDLEGRGFSEEEIECYGFFSVAPQQYVVASVPWTFPGVYRSRFSVAGTGYTVPFFNWDGLVHGYQVRLDGAEGGKYRWAKSILSSHLSLNGKLELPLSYVPAGGADGRAVGLVEGGLKALLAARREGLTVIGAAAGQFSSSPQQLSQMLAGVEVAVIYPDGGDALNPSVMRRWCWQVRELRRRGLRVEVAWWGQVEKESNDIDEIPPGVRVRSISPEQFYALARQAQRVRAERQLEVAGWEVFNPPPAASYL
jgi:hypothetical protein